MVPRGKPCGSAGPRDEGPQKPRERPRDEGASQPGLSFAKRQPGEGSRPPRAHILAQSRRRREHRVRTGARRPREPWAYGGNRTCTATSQTALRAPAFPRAYVRCAHPQLDPQRPRTTGVYECGACNNATGVHRNSRGRGIAFASSLLAAIHAYTLAVCPVAIVDSVQQAPHSHLQAPAFPHLYDTESLPYRARNS